ncbi:hypothetical protein [Cytobacillus pseudoceanisediminis]
MLDTLAFLKEYKTKSGLSVDDFLKNKYKGEGEWIRKEDELIFNIVISGLNVQYKWKVVNGNVEAVSGKAVELTPDLHPGSKKIAERKMRLPSRDLKIYEYIMHEYGEQGSMDGAFAKAEKEFGLSDGEAEEIYLSIDSLIYK